MARRQGMKDLVLAHHAKNPRDTALDIAAALDCNPAYVRATAIRNGIKLKSASGNSGNFYRVPNHIKRYLAGHADNRGIGVDELIERIVETVAVGGLVNAILDDDEAGAS